MENTNASFNILVILTLGLQSFVISMLWFSHCSLEEKILSLLNKPDEIVSDVDEAEAEESIESDVDEAEADDSIESDVDEVDEAEADDSIESEVDEQKSIKPEEKSYWFFM